MVPIRMAVVPVAGAGTRLLPATKSQPKEMLPIGRKPVVQYVVEELEAAGLTTIVFITGRGKASIENHFDRDAELVRLLERTHRYELLKELDYEETDVSFFYTRQREQRGLGDAIRCARKFTGEFPFVVALGDSIISGSDSSPIVRRLINCFQETGAAAVIAFEEVQTAQVGQYGIAKPKGQGDVFELEDLIEKPTPAKAPSTLAVAARYVLAPGIYDAIERTAPGKNNEIQLTDAIRLILQAGGKVYGVKLAPNEKRYDIGNFQSYFRSFVEIALADREYGPALREHIMRLLGQK